MLHGLVSNKRLIKMLNTEQFFLYSYYSFVKWFFISILPVLFHDVPPLQVRVHLFMLFPVIFILYYFLPTHLAIGCQLFFNVSNVFASVKMLLLQKCVEVMVRERNHLSFFPHI